MKEPFVNIIILNLNNYKDTSECINSILKINYLNWGITLVDNGSTDNSLKKLKSTYSKNRKIKFISNNINLGFSKANNQAMKKDLFDADYFLILNNDTVVEKKFLTNLIKEKKDLLAPLVYNYYSKEELSKKDYPGEFNFFLGGGKGKKPVIGKTAKVGYASGCCWLIRKELFIKTEGFNEEYFAYNEEVEWAYRLKKSGYDFYISGISKIWHKGARTSSKLSGFKLKFMNRNIIWFEKEYASKYAYVVFLIYLLSYKIPKNFLKIIFFKKNFSKNLKSFLLGINEGLFSNPQSIKTSKDSN